jgi:ATP-dependent helicase YprA (DUF1998 family)
MPLNPIAFTDRVVEGFLRYQLTAYPFADARLDSQMRELLSLKSTRATPLLRGPFLTLSRAFEQGCTVRQLIEENLLHPLMRERIPASIERVYRHQEEAIRSIAQRRPTLISTGTGSGKTECFLYPVVSRCLQLRDANAEPGVVAVIVYPMNALAEDQLLRLRELLAGTGVTFGMYVGKTPRARADVTGKRLSTGASRAEYKKQVIEAQQRGAGETVYPAEEVCSREEMRTPGKQPRILLTNVNQMELLLTRQTDAELFAGAQLEFLVFDEAHTFTGAQGAETACLIRRLLHFCQKQPGETTCIATSATIVDPKEPDAARRFAGRFFGVQKEAVTTIGESYSAQEWPSQRWVSPAPADPSGALRLCLEADDGSLERLNRALSALCARSLPAGEKTQENLYQLLTGAETVFQLSQILERPLALSETASRLGSILNRPCSEEEVLAWLSLGAMASKDSRPLVRPVVHAFIRGLGGATVEFPENNNDPKLHFSAEQRQLQEGVCRLPLSTCTVCGQHYFSAHLHDFEHTGRQLGGGQNSLEGRYWEPMDSSKGGQRCVLVDELVSGDSLPPDRVAEVWLCRHCGTFHDQALEGCSHCGRTGPKVRLFSIQTKKENPGNLSSCLACESNGRRIGTRYREPTRAVKTIAVADIHVLAQDMINHLDPQRLLVFCDNRQDAAFQAGWMRDHARRFRLRSLIANEINKKSTNLGDLTLALSGLFERDESLSRALLPEVWRVAPMDAPEHHKKEREKFLRMSLLREITLAPRQVLGLEPWGKMRIDYVGLSARLPFVVEVSRKLRVPPEDIAHGMASILDYLRRTRVLFDNVHKTFSRYWNDGDSEVMNGYLPHTDPPKGTKFTRDSSDQERYVTQWQGSSGDTYIRQAVRKWGVQDAELGTFLNELFRFFCEKTWLVPVKLTDAQGKALPGQSGLYQIDSAKLELVPGQGIWKCKRCGRKTARPTPLSACPAWRCSGEVSFQPENEDDYNLQLLRKQYDLIRPEEHTAMVPHDRREKIENWFKDPQSKATNCLVCTQTLEMGVDIGALDAVLMRNVPPLPANYWQRVGRAGRRNRMAVNVTYCRDVSHDRSYFFQPERLLGGRIDAPTFNLSNPLMVRRHIHAAILTHLQQAARGDQSLRSILDSAFPSTVRPWLFDGNNLRPSLMDLSPLQQAVSLRKDEILQHIRAIFASGWPDEDREVVEDALLDSAVDGFVEMLTAVIKRIQRRLQWAHQTITRLNTQQQVAGTLDKDHEMIRRRCERYIKRLKGEIKRGRTEAEGQDETVTYSVLAVEGFLPGYGLERGSVLGTAEIPYWEAGNSGELKLPRPAAMALREYVPGNLIYANGHRFVSRRYQLQPAEERERIAVEVLEASNAMREAKSEGSGSAATIVLSSLPMSDLDLIHVSQISDEEDYRFQMGVAMMGMERPRHSGGTALEWGTREVHLLKGQRFLMANVGCKAEIQRRINYGYLICSVCGDSVSPMASGEQKNNFKKSHKERCGNQSQEVALEFALHAEVDTDVLRFPGFADATEAYSALESIRFAASSCLEMAQEDLQILVTGHFQGSESTGYLVDPMPGGSGLLEQLIQRFAQVRQRALDFTRECPSGCQTSCPDCLQTYRNSFYHPLLDRNRASSFLEASSDHFNSLRSIPAIHANAPEPQGANAPVNAAERRLRRLLLDAGFPEATWQERIPIGAGLGETTPDAILRPTDEDLQPVAIYLDGMSAGIHGNPQAQERDRHIRAQLRECGWQVITITAHELHDRPAMVRHFRHLANYLEIPQIKSRLVETEEWFSVSS